MLFRRYVCFCIGIHRKYINTNCWKCLSWKKTNWKNKNVLCGKNTHKYIAIKLFVYCGIEKLRLQKNRQWNWRKKSTKKGSKKWKNKKGNEHCYKRAKWVCHFCFLFGWKKFAFLCIAFPFLLSMLLFIIVNMKLVYLSIRRTIIKYNWVWNVPNHFECIIHSLKCCWYFRIHNVSSVVDSILISNS